MDLSQYVDALRAHLRATAAAGTEQTQATAGLLADALEPAVRLAVTDALAAMAAEVTAALDDAAVDVVVRGRDPEVVVTRAAAPPEAAAEPARPPLRPRTTPTPWPGSASGCPSRSSRGPTPRQPPPASRSTPGWCAPSPPACRHPHPPPPARGRAAG